jgi:hypothetical protein
MLQSILDHIDDVTKVDWKVLAALVANPHCDNEVLVTIKDKIIDGYAHNQKRFKLFATLLDSQRLTILIEKLLGYCDSADKVAQVFTNKPIEYLLDTCGNHKIRVIANLITLCSHNEFILKKIVAEYSVDRAVKINALNPDIGAAVVNALGLDKTAQVKREQQANIERHANVHEQELRVANEREHLQHNVIGNVPADH